MGLLSVVATPIGNLEDITARAVRTLREVDLVVAEDTRVTRRLLSHLGLDTPAIPFYEFSDPRGLIGIISRLKQGGQDDDVFALDGIGFDRGCHLGQGAAVMGLVDLGQLASDKGLAVRADGRAVSVAAIRCGAS